jgi:hypothetical protein
MTTQVQSENPTEARALPRPVLILLLSLIVSLGVHGLWMIVHPWSWYVYTPGVIYHGPLNAHFIRDVGILFIVMAGVYGYVLKHPDRGRLALRVGAWFFGLHALSHVVYAALGHLTLAQTAEDLPLTLLLAALSAGLLHWKWLGRPAT